MNSNIVKFPISTDRPIEKPWTLEELCDFLQVESWWVYEKTSKKQIPYCKVGKFLRFLPSEIMAWLESNKNGGAQ